ncbi:type II toxin-antitoxin system death-on-curing family toxin [Micromonospora sp. NPDC049204]|uniref:type II toxin-antitoxin system death-on-curing family toxin n=1 Tax=Micromonospora sp. NPDC049204 TaxID=3154351 RepID=UPI0033EDDEC0
MRGAGQAGHGRPAPRRRNLADLGSNLATICRKAAALLHSLVNNHPFVDGNKRIGWIAAIAFLLQNRAITIAQLDEVDQDVAYDLVISVTESRLTEVAEIAAALRKLF